MSPRPQIQGPKTTRHLGQLRPSPGRCLATRSRIQHVHGPSRGRRGADFLIDGGVTAISAVGLTSLQRVEAAPVLPAGFRSVLERYQELAGPFETTRCSVLFQCTRNLDTTNRVLRLVCRAVHTPATERK